MFSPSNSFHPFQFANDHDPENQISISLEEGIHLPNSPFISDVDDFFSGFLSEQQESHYKVSEVLGFSLANHEEAQEEEEEEEEEAFPEASNNKAMKIKEKKRASGEKIKQVPRKRSGKKDRHSKIYTAQGPRDRRMRLSLPIARKFFDLQDILGFDKASKTIEWLFKKSKTAINELKQGFPGVKSSSFSVGGKSTVSSTSESEVVSGVKLKMGDQGENSLSGTLKEKRSKGTHKQYFNPVARESREKARARARERTREKMSIKGLDMTNQNSHSQTNPNTLDPSRHVEDGEHLGLEHGGGAEEVSYHLLQQKMDSTSIGEKLWGLSTSGYSHRLEAPGEANILENEISGFPGKWVLDNIDSDNLVHALKLTAGKFHDNNDPVFMNNPFVLESIPPTSLPINLMSFSNPYNGNPSPYPVGIQFPDIHFSKHGSLYGSL